MRTESVVDKLVWTGLIGAILTGLSFTAYGLAVDEFLPFVAFSFLPAAVLVAASTAVSVFASERSRRTAKLAWVLAMLLAPASLAYVAVTTENMDLIGDSEVVFAFVTLILTFPSGFVGPAIVIGLEWAFPQSIALQEPLLHNLLLWAVSGLAAAYQWFVVVPWLKRQVMKD